MSSHKHKPSHSSQASEAIAVCLQVKVRVLNNKLMRENLLVNLHRLNTVHLQVLYNLFYIDMITHVSKPPRAIKNVRTNLHLSRNGHAR